MITERLRQQWCTKANTVYTAYKQGLIELNSWELSFISNIRGDVLSGYDLSMNQSIALNKLYNKVE